MAAKASTRGVMNGGARYSVEARDEFNEASKLRIADEAGHRLFTMTRLSDPESLLWPGRWQLQFQCPGCGKEHMVTLPSPFGRETLPQGTFGELRCDCDKRSRVAVVGRKGNVRIACQKVKAHVERPYLVNVDPQDVLRTIERTTIRESVRGQRKRREQLRSLVGY